MGANPGKDANYVPDLRDTMHNYPGAASMASPPARIDDRDRSDHSAHGRKRARGQNSVSKSMGFGVSRRQIPNGPYEDY